MEGWIGNMKIAYLVFAYKNPVLMKRSIDVLASGDAGFFIHIDRKVSMEPFAGISGPNIVFCEPRLPVYWAEFSGIDAIVSLIRHALSAKEHYDYCVLLSGTEYPLRSGEYIRSSFEQNRGLEFINVLKMPAPGKPMSRISTLRYP